MADETFPAFLRDKLALPPAYLSTDLIPVVRGSATYYVSPADLISNSAMLPDASNAVLPDARIGLGLEDASENFYTLGSSLYPQYATPTITAATTTNGSPTIVVTNAANIAIGDAIYGAFVTVASGANVLNIVGTTITMSADATATNASPVAVQFGQTRFAAGKTAFTDTIGAKTGLFGVASRGHSTWVARYFPAAGFPQGFPANQGTLFSVSLDGNQAGLFAARTSDSIATSPPYAIGSMDFVANDHATLRATSWARYTQSNVLPSATPGFAFNEESTLFNGWVTVDDDPYNQDPFGNATNLRLDLGRIVDATTPSNNATAALQISNISGGSPKYRAGITINRLALDTDAGRIAPAIQMGPNHSFAWFQAAATPSWSLYSDQSAGFASAIKLHNAGVMEVVGEGVQLRLNATVGADQAALVLQNNGTTKWTIARQTDDTFLAYDNTNSLAFLGVTTAGDTTLGEFGKTATIVGLSDPGCVRSTSTLTKTSNTTLATVPGLSVALTAGKTYRVSAHLTGVSGAAGGIKAGLVASGGLTATSASFTGITWNGSTVVAQTTVTSLGSNVAASTAVYSDLYIEGVIVVNVAGTINLQAAQNVSDAASTTVLINSSFSCTRLV